MRRIDEFARWWLAVLPVLGALVLGDEALGSLADCMDATCRISTPDGSRGTGCAFERSQGYVFVLTAAHVVGRHREVQCEFWRAGHQSVPLAGEVIAADESADAAVVCLPESAFAGVVPECVPVAPRGYTLRAGQTVTSVGCAKGAWATGFTGHVVEYTDGSLCFTPPPADGRSGSAVFDARGEAIVGVVWGRSDAEGRGYAVTVETLYRALNFKRTAAGWVHAPLPRLDASGGGPREASIVASVSGGACGPNGCPSGGYLLPYRNDQLRQNDQQNRELDDLGRRLDRQEQVWPTLPPQGGVPASEPPQAVEPNAEAEQTEGPVSGLGVIVALAAAVGVGAFLFYVVGKQ